jgi:hypothetical protein
MNSNQNNPVLEIAKGKLYYFLLLHKGKYYTVAIGWINEDLIATFTSGFNVMETFPSFILTKINVGEHTFAIQTSEPIYLLDYENDDAFEFAGDKGELDLFASGRVPPDAHCDPVIDFPSYWEKGVEPMIDFKLADQFYHQKNGVWIPLEMSGN